MVKAFDPISILALHRPAHLTPSHNTAMMGKHRHHDFIIYPLPK